MAWLKKKADPISDHARALNTQIAALESQIKKLDSQIQQPVAPKLRSTTLPGSPFSRASQAPPPVVTQEPVFEEINQQPIKVPEPPPPPPEMFNEFGVRKYDLPALWERLRNHLRGPTTTNPRLVSYLAAGGFHGSAPHALRKTGGAESFLRPSHHSIRGAVSDPVPLLPDPLIAMTTVAPDTTG